MLKVVENHNESCGKPTKTPVALISQGKSALEHCETEKNRLRRSLCNVKFLRSTVKAKKSPAVFILQGKKCIVAL